METTEIVAEMNVGGFVKRNLEVVESSQKYGGVVERDEEQMGKRRVRNGKERRKTNSSDVTRGAITGGTLAFVTLLLIGPDAAVGDAVRSDVMASGATLLAANQSDTIPDPIIRPPPTSPFSLSPLPPPIRGPIVPAPPAPCFGVTVAYVIESIINIPSVWNGSVKPYGFKSKIELLNTGKRDLVGWEVRVEFTRNELITLLGNTQVEFELPYPGSALLFSSIDDQSDRLITAIHAGGDVRQYVVFAEVFGTEFGAATAGKALPRTLYLTTPGFHCASNRPQFPSPNRIQVCCKETAYPPPPPPRPPARLPPVIPALTVQIDVTAASDLDHQMLVTIRNLQADRRVGPPRHEPWALSWRWTQNEIVWEASGAQATQQGNCQQQSASSAVYGAAIATAHSCSPRPTFVDLPSGAYGSESGRDLGATLGVRLSCCKNGSIGLRSFPYGDPALAQYQGNTSLAQFRLRIGRTRQFKAIPSIAPPRNLSLGLPGIVCSAGVRIDSTQFPVNPSRNLSAVATWRYACYRDPSSPPPRPACCVSFSAAFNNTGSPQGAWVFHPTSLIPFLLSSFSPPYLIMPSLPSLLPSFPPPLLPSSPPSLPLSLLYPSLGAFRYVLSIINRGNNSVSDWVALIALPSIANTSTIYSFGYANVSATSRMLYGFTGSNSWLEGTPSPFKGKSFGNVQSIFK
ncbi:unnamed protein product, partial [Closterium sp. NIES-65]